MSVNTDHFSDIWELDPDFFSHLDYSAPMELTFITSAADSTGWPKGDRPEVALAGRSNAGKSSFLNALGASRIAKVSQVPGKTRLLNFFDAGTKYRFVDMPGYGFSKRSGDEQAGWEGLIETYIRERANLVGLILLMDIRRDWTADEIQVRDFAESHGRRVALVLTKMDTLSKSEAQKRKQEIARQSHERDIFLVTERDRKTIADVEDFVFKNWVKSK